MSQPSPPTTPMTQTTIQTTREDHLIAALAALAIGIHILESALPSPLPGVKPGLANVVTLMVLCRYGWRVAVWVTLLRVLVGSVLIGTFLSPTFFLSAAGAVCSLLMLGILQIFSLHFPLWRMGPLGLGVAAAMAHMSGQFWLAYVLFVPHAGIQVLYPVLMTAAAGLGVVSGILTRVLLNGLRDDRDEKGESPV
jgi:heptaprenyl diphosphate synthase